MSRIQSMSRSYRITRCDSCMSKIDTNTFKMLHRFPTMNDSGLRQEPCSHILRC